MTMTPDIERVEVPVLHRASDVDDPYPVSRAVYDTQYMGGGDLPTYAFTFMRIDSDQWARVSGELAVYDEWHEGEPEGKDKWPVVLRVAAYPDRVEDGFVSIAHWLRELMEWAEALHKEPNEIS